MLKVILHKIFYNKERKKSTAYEFFVNAKSREQNKVIKTVLKKVNEEQKEVLRKARCA